MCFVLISVGLIVLALFRRSCKLQQTCKQTNNNCDHLLMLQQVSPVDRLYFFAFPMTFFPKIFIELYALCSVLFRWNWFHSFLSFDSRWIPRNEIGVQLFSVPFIVRFSFAFEVGAVFYL